MGQDSQQCDQSPNGKHEVGTALGNADGDVSIEVCRHCGNMIAESGH